MAREAVIWERGDRRRKYMIPSIFPGAQQNMLRTVTSVERYQSVINMEESTGK